MASRCGTVSRRHHPPRPGVQSGRTPLWRADGAPVTAHGPRHLTRALVQHTFAWFDVYGAVAPATGARFFLELPYPNAGTFPTFIEAFAHRGVRPRVSRQPQHPALG